jgi:ferrochelatase
VAGSIETFWREHGRGKFLLMSFHGLPKRNVELGDPYRQQCEVSARLIAEKLKLADGEWQLVFQSRFGKQEWLKPYCVDTLQELPGRGVKELDVVCPGFAVDCLETLEEIAIANQEVFLEAGGTAYRMIPALNDSGEHARALLQVAADKSLSP